MKTFLSFFYSKITMGVILIVFAVACGWATFIENDYGIPSSKAVVYDALWFKILLTLLCLNILGVIFKDRILQKGKITLFLFHISFVIILLGGAITDIFGYEGMMSIRENSKSDEFLSNESYISVDIITNERTVSEKYKVRFAQIGRNKFKESLSVNNKKYTIELIDFKHHKQGDAEFEIIKLSISDGLNDTSVTIAGAAGMKTKASEFSFFGNIFALNYGSIFKKLPFSIYLNDFIMDRYPGSNSPQGYKSKVVLIDESANLELPYDIFMNHILKYKGYRFFQSSYDEDEKGTVLSVNKDGWGTNVTYLGYIIMAIGMLSSLLHKKTRFVSLAKLKPKSALVIIGLIIGGSAFSNDSLVIPAEHSEKFSKLLIQDNKGRIKPMYTHASEILRKVSRKTEIEGMNPVEWLLAMYSNPDNWYDKRIIKTKHDGIEELLGVDSEYVSINDVFPQNNLSSYKLGPAVSEAYRKKPAERSKFDTEVIRADERINVLLMTLNYQNLNIFPSSIDSLGRWYNPFNSSNSFAGRDSIYVMHVMNLYQRELQHAMQTTEFSKVNEILESIFVFQQNNTNYKLPGEKKRKLEILYYKSDVFQRIAYYYLLIGFLLLILQFIHVFYERFSIRIPQIIAFILIAILFVIHGGGLTVRWIISNHAPWSNGYEALIFIAWIMVLAGLLFSKKSGVTLSTAAILTFLTLNTAHLSFMDPQITNLVPVLNSFWLIIHVAIITASYGFLGIGALVAAYNLLLMFFETKRNKQRVDVFVRDLSRINELILTVGLYLLTIGTFLGGVWANESWGRYWGWDPKETWALITILVYAFILHMRMIPGLKGSFAFNLMALIGFGSVIMTYFGVNYYLSGLHSYAAGDKIPIPVELWITLGIITIVAILSYINQLRLEKK